MAVIRHIALAVPDPERSAAFYEKTFGPNPVGHTESVLADGVYLSDGSFNLVLLKYKTDVAAGDERAMNHVGAHHFGFIVDDLEAARKEIEANGGVFFLDLHKHKDTLYYEQKYRDPNGIVFDLSEKGWVGTKK